MPAADPRQAQVGGGLPAHFVPIYVVPIHGVPAYGTTVTAMSCDSRGGWPGTRISRR